MIAEKLWQKQQPRGCEFKFFSHDLPPKIFVTLWPLCSTSRSASVVSAHTTGLPRWAVKKLQRATAAPLPSPRPRQNIIARNQHRPQSRHRRRCGGHDAMSVASQAASSHDAHVVVGVQLVALALILGRCHAPLLTFPSALHLAIGPLSLIA